MILKNGKRIDGCTDTLPVGTVQPFLGLTPPLGYLICQGQLISKVEYPELYNICKSTFGTETETHFYLPDLRGKTIAGYSENDNTMNSIGKLLGSATHIHNVKDHYHILPYFDGNSGFAIMDTSFYNKNKTYPITQPSENNWYFAKTSNLGDVSLANGQHGTSTATDVQTEATSNFQPTMVMNWIVKAVMLIPQYFTVENTLTSVNTNNALSAAQGKILNDSKLSLTGGTLTGNITLATTYPTFVLRSGNLLYNTTPSTTEYPCVLWTDKNNTAMGRLEMIAASDGSRYMSLYAIKPGDTAVGSFIKIGWDASGNKKSTIDGSCSIEGSITVGSGFGKRYVFKKTITPTTEWADVGISKWDLPDGAYIVHMTGIWDTDRTWQADGQYAGLMSWYDGQTNANERSEIALHQTGHAFNGYVISLSTVSNSRSTDKDICLQIKSNIAFTRATEITFTFVKIV